jgi:hypothetical protein
MTLISSEKKQIKVHIVKEAWRNMGMKEKRKSEDQ